MSPRANPSSADGGGGGGASAPPFHSRTATAAASRGLGGGGGRVHYQPSVHQFSCRGAFHLRPKGEAGAGSAGSSRSRREEGDDDLEELLKDAFVCHGFQTRLRHVADYPLARSREEAVRWFEGSSPAGGGGLPLTGGRPGGGDGGAEGEGSSRGEGETKPADAAPPEASFSSYGTTQVNVLTLREVPVAAGDDARDPATDGDPFAGFGALGPSAGMLNPFGSLFGGFFGEGMADPWGQQQPGPGAGARGNGNGGGAPGGWLRGSRSVSSSTRMGRDENGKRVATTVTTTTVMDGEGKRTTETVTTERHLDDGGRTETRKVTQTEGGDGGGEADAKRPDGGAKGDARGNAVDLPLPPRSMVSPQSTFRPAPAAATDPSRPASQTEVAVVTTDNLLGVSVSDSAAADPDSAIPQSSARNDADSGWRKTEYLFRLGRFVPPFMVVNKYYQDKEAEERRRREVQREFDGMRGRRAEGDAEEEKKGAAVAASASATLAEAPSRAEYYLQRTYVQMGKNLSMMGTLLGEMARPDFPSRAYRGGLKILDSMGPTAERTRTLIGDVWEMWTGWGGWSDGGEGGVGSGRRR